MKITRCYWLVLACCVALLTACASDPKTPKEPQKPSVELSVLMDKAAASEKTKRIDIALREYEEAAKLYPASSLPWMRIAQIRYEAGNYGEAISAAQQAVSRDDRNNVAHSILAVSGLRVSSIALDELRRHNDLAGPVQKEAQELAKVLRESLGEQVLVPAGNTAVIAAPTPTPPAPKPATRRRQTAAKSPAATSVDAGSGSNPFDMLKQ